MSHRRFPDVPAAAPVSKLKAEAKQVRKNANLDISIDVKLITPMFGGGHTSRKPEPVSLFSAKAIRGQLRYWWRVMESERLVNTTNMDVVELLAIREAELFGDTSRSSPFDVVIGNLRSPAQPFRRYDEQDGEPYGFLRFGAVMYALFPTTQDHQDVVDQIVREGHIFGLTIRWQDTGPFSARVNQLTTARQKENYRRMKAGRPALPDPCQNLADLQPQLERAMWAWLNFGGLGSRTRRGVGSVATNEPRFRFEGDNGQIRHSLPSRVKVFVNAQAERDTEPEAERQMLAWSQSVRAYKEFRQDRGGRMGSKEVLRRDGHDLCVNNLNNIPGQTEWPDADSIRRASGCALDGVPVTLPGGAIYSPHDHTPPAVSERSPDCYPKAILGLPINYQFADGPSKESDRAGIPRTSRDPDKAIVLPRRFDASGRMVDDANRMSSPIITRPLRRNGKWFAAVIVIRTPELAKLAAKLKYKDGTGNSRSLEIPSDQIFDSAGRSVLAKLSVMRNKPDAITAFEDYIQQDAIGFKPVN